MAYKDTCEYAFDLLDHYYQLHHNQILSLGKDNLQIMIPETIFALLKAKDSMDKTMFPIQFKGIDIQVYNGSFILFALKEVH